jgi:alpha-1,6-mannosyltransferase
MTFLSRLKQHFAPATNVALLLLGVAFVQYCRDGVLEYKHFINGYSRDVLAQIALYCAGVLLVIFARTNRWTLYIIFGVALAVRLVGVFAPEFLSSDLYRYVWDGKVQAAGINPYRYFPADEHLQFLRDGQIYPNINRKEYAHTIYPPGAQLIFLTITRISETEACMKAAMVGFEALACWALLQILPLLGRGREEILLYAWHPLGVWEIGSSGHVDAVIVGLLSAAALALLRGRITRSACWITIAAMVKMYPLVLLLAFGRRLTARMMLLCVGIIAAGYALYASVGAGVLGFLAGFTREEGLNTGDRYFFLAWAHRYMHLPFWPGLYIAGSTLMLAGIAFWGRLRFREPKLMLGLALAISIVATLLFSPHYPWYFLWILPFAVMLRYLPAIVLTAEATYWFSTELALPGEKMFRMNEYMYSIFFAAVVVDLLVRWWRNAHSIGHCELFDSRENPKLQDPPLSIGKAYE